LPATGGETLRLLQLGTAMVLLGLGLGMLSGRRRHACDGS
jgi:LPXTG-motif cell wall-anchored protein